ncbi:hypothetical protein ABTY61_23010 [Kitasatospora sp. NPDC096128]|uniref:hypothetical protein n=1 Tax=Kitasatospora sp. NPDC096128 TaxID=3155547 RepID=UPI00332C6122
MHVGICDGIYGRVSINIGAEPGPDADRESNASKLTPAPAPCRIAASNAPLEVGTTLPSRTLLHLDLEGAVARWRYASTWITLLWRIGPSPYGP